MINVQGMYFSGTGTTEKIVKCIAYEAAAALEGAAAKAEDINFTPLEARQKQYVFGPEDLVVFGVPVIAGRVPNVLLKFLDTLEGGGALAVPVVLYGNRNYDDGLIELRNILEDRGFHTIAGGAFIGEHSFSRILAAGRPDREDMDKAVEFAKAIAGKIRKAGADIAGTAPIQVKGEDPIRTYYQPRDRKGEPINILKVKPKLDESKCTRCGDCVAACPMGSIKADNPGVVEGICIKCCGCEKKCPEGALYFDDPGYIYHKEELEFMYADKRREPEVFI
ncbi:MAG: 4Fe-4S binding protein [Firmicutes bacterium]|nr:4Fe-4S binding protein [Bacillota bacterium]